MSIASVFLISSGNTCATLRTVVEPSRIYPPLLTVTKSSSSLNKRRGVDLKLTMPAPTKAERSLNRPALTANGTEHGTLPRRAKRSPPTAPTLTPTIWPARGAIGPEHGTLPQRARRSPPITSTSMPTANPWCDRSRAQQAASSC